MCTFVIQISVLILVRHKQMNIPSVSRAPGLEPCSGEISNYITHGFNVSLRENILTSPPPPKKRILEATTARDVILLVGY
jgi:hypothetical protein